MSALDGPVLSVRDLVTTARVGGRERRLVDGASFDVARGRTLGLVGESGAGKSLTALSIMGLLDEPAVRVAGGSIWFSDGPPAPLDLASAPEAALRAVRGRRIAMIFQEPAAALNPVLTIGDQVVEPLRIHGRLPPGEAHGRAVALLEAVGMPAAAAQARAYPHQLSGGMKQRAMIAMALACQPALLIADEPTTALDVTVQAQILTLLRRLQRECDMAMLLITHDFKVVAQTCDDVAVMHAGRIVEQAAARTLLREPRHPHTVSLLAPARRRFGDADRRPPQGATPLVTVRGLVKHFAAGGGPVFGTGRRKVHAVDGISFEISRGETLALVGESGCGKTTVGRAVLRLTEPTSGSVGFDGVDVLGLGRAPLRALRRRMQLVFQDALGALDPRQTIEEIVAEPLIIHRIARARAERRERVADLLGRVGLQPETMVRRPHELSGGERQRVGIARALAPSPDFIVADEPVSSLDASMQAQIVDLLAELRARAGLSYLFVSHDLGLVRHLADRVAVMYLGELVELGPATAVFAAPAHPYTRALLSAATGGPAPVILDGDPPSPLDPPDGCRFHPRCPVFAARRDPRCQQTKPALTAFGTAAAGTTDAIAGAAAPHVAACHYAGE